MGNQFTFRPMTEATPIHLSYSLSLMVIVEEVMAKLLTKFRYENWDCFRKGNGTLGFKSNLFQCY